MARRVPTCKVGERLPTLAQVLAEPATVWQTVTLPRQYGQGARTVEIALDTAIWYRSSEPRAPLRRVLIRDPHGQFEPQALLCSDPAVDP